MMTLANILTIARLFLLPPIIALFFIEQPWAAWTCLALYVIAAITDFLDGWIARKYNQITPLGTFLDPIADKIFVGTLLLLLIGFYRLPGLWMLPAVIILAREFLVSGLREFLGPYNVKFPVTKLAKWKTALQMLSIGFLIIGPYAPYTLETGQWGLVIAAVITIITGWAYLKAGLAHIKKMT